MASNKKVKATKGNESLGMKLQPAVSHQTIPLTEYSRGDTKARLFAAEGMTCRDEAACVASAITI